MGFSNDTTSIPSPPKITNSVPRSRAPIRSIAIATSATVRGATQSAAIATPSASPALTATGSAAALCGGGIVIVAVAGAAAVAAGALL